MSLKTLITLNLALTLCASPAWAQQPDELDVPDMQEQAQQAGIDHVYDGPFEFFVGGGGASFDCNGDKKAELFLAGGTNPLGFYINQSEVGGALKFEKSALVAGTENPTEVTGAYPINLDNDDHIDLVVLRVGENQLYKGEGNCTFSLANSTYAFDGQDAWTTGFSAIWEKDQTYPTLGFINYIDRKAPGTPWGTCEDNQLVRASGTQPTFDARTALSPSYCGLSGLFTDWNNNGQFDLRVTNDRQYYKGGQEQLWAISTAEGPRAYGEQDGWRALQIWGMGIAEHDVTGDGKPEYALSSMGDTMLQSLQPEGSANAPSYGDIAFARGTTAHRPYTGDQILPSTGWHTEFADFNNDARSDLFIAKGNVSRMEDFAAFDPDNMLLATSTGKFVEMGDKAGIALNTRGRGAIVEDFNLDGQLDLVVINRETPINLFRNQGVKTSWGHRAMGNFVAIELDNGDINPHAVGAKIMVKTGNHVQTKRVQIGGGHASGHLGFTHFGLGVADRAEIRVQWPDGSTSAPYRVFVNQFVKLTKQQTTPIYWMPQ